MNNTNNIDDPIKRANVEIYIDKFAEMSRSPIKSMVTAYELLSDFWDTAQEAKVKEMFDGVKPSTPDC